MGSDAMSATIIDGKQYALTVCEGIKARVDRLRAQGTTPKLAVVLVGDDPASAVYVRNKCKKGEALGVEVEVHRFDASVTMEELFTLIDRLNGDNSVHGVIIQSPVPEPLELKKLLIRVDPKKDVDGIHPHNQGMLLSDQAQLVACTPKGVIKLIESTGTVIRGKRAVVVGRSCLVGKPCAMLLMNNDATVSVCHSKTVDLGALTREADILVCAVGHPGLISADMIKPGAVVIDVGMNRVNDRWEGDVDFEGARETASFLTPVPGGVGPMTVAMLMDNTVLAAESTQR